MYIDTHGAVNAVSSFVDAAERGGSAAAAKLFAAVLGQLVDKSGHSPSQLDGATVAVVSQLNDHFTSVASGNGADLHGNVKYAVEAFQEADAAGAQAVKDAVKNA